MPDPQAVSRSLAGQALLVCPDRAIGAALTQLLARQFPAIELLPFSSYPSGVALAEMASSAGLRLCFLDVGSARESAFRFLADIAKLAPGLAIVALLGANDPDLILQCLRKGASEFLIQPFTPDQLQAAFQKLSSTLLAAEEAAASRARVYCIMPAKGACGATTLACNLAFHLHRSGSGRVLLADMDPLTGTLAFLLKMKSTYSFLDAITHAENLDADLWKAIVTTCQGIDVLLSPDNPVDSITETHDPAPVLGFSRQAYDKVVLDIGGAFGEWNVGVAKLSDELLLVTSNELASLHAAQRVLLYLEESGVVASKIRVVVNRYSKDVGLNENEIETALRREVLHVLPSDYESIHDALIEGRPALPASKFGKGIAALVALLAGQARPEKKSSPLGGLLSAFGR